MPTAAATAPALFRIQFPILTPSSSSFRLMGPTTNATTRAAIPISTTGRRKPRSVCCQVAVTADSSVEDLEAAEKIGKKVRVKVPLKVYHVTKAPDLDLLGMEGVVKQYVGLWKGKKISANLPFKVEFFIAVDGLPNPVRFFAHLKEDEFDVIE